VSGDETPAPPGSEMASGGRTALIRGLLADMVTVGNQVLLRLGERFTGELGVSLAELDLLSVLKDAPDRRMRMSEIGSRLTLSNASITRLVDGLEERRYARRVASRGDRRVVYAQLTAEGLDLLDQARPIAAGALEEYLGQYLATAEIEQLRSLLAKATVRG